MVATLLMFGTWLPTPVRAVSSTGLDSWRVVPVALPVLDTEFIRPRNTLIATVDFDHPVFGNNLVELDANTGAVLRTVHVGTKPSTVAISDDFTTAYVGLIGASDVVVVDLLTFTVKQRFAIWTGAQGWSSPAEDLAVVPGRTDTVVVASTAGVVSVFRDGEALPKSAYHSTNQIVFSNGVLYGANDRSSAVDFVAMTVDDEGVTVTDHHQFPIGSHGDMKPAGAGRITTTGGQLVDPTGPTVLGDFHQYGAFEPTVANDRITYIGDPNGGAIGSTVSVFRLSTGTRIASRSFPQLADAHGLVATRTGFAVVTWHGFYLLGPLAPATSPVIPSTVPTFVDSLTAVGLPVHIGRMRYDTRRRLLYATVGKWSPTRANELVAVNPMTGAIEKSLTLGGPVTALAISDDQSRAYVGVNDTFEVAVVDLDTFTERSRFTLEGIARGPDPSPYGPEINAFDIEVRPGTNNVVAVTMAEAGYSYSRGVSVYVDGARAGAAWPYPANPGHLAFADASTLYATDAVEVPGELYRYTVDAAGGLVYEETVEWIDLRDIEITPDGRGWGPFGGVVDLARKRSLGVIWDVTGGLEPVLAQNRVYAVSNDGISEYDATTYRRLGFKRFFLNYTFDNPVERTTFGFATTSGSALVLLIPPSCRGLVPTVVGAGAIVGTPGDDVIVGSSGNDTIDGMGGDDIICSLGGNDRLLGGLGNDDLDGGPGTDLVYLGADAVKHGVDLDNVADDGALWADGSREADNVRSSNETIVGSPGPDRIVGTTGKQTLRGGDGNDMLFGGDGNDVLDGGSGINLVHGGEGLDSCRVRRSVDSADCEVYLP